ncbi:pili synthesis usher PapC-like protein [Acinetobacter calcoaceticus]|uniref:Pili synthesis usher PapC-like protein n=1 Tax=Acinetobacter calcoaceticus TaxID=471 RepID=A0A4R1X9Z1_ACICA|nr:pili synthesis usher PapC-like protein [Acinetobacter calcoaceticus]
MFHLSKLSLSCLYLFAFSINAQVQDDQASKNQNPLIGQYHYIFSSNALYGTNRDIDLNAFNTRNYIAPGLYNVNLSLNNTELADTTVKFEHSNGASTAVLCVDAALLSQLDLKAALLEKLPQQPCLSIKDIDSDANYDFNLQQLKLNIFIPLIDIEQRPVGYINPALFDYGVTSAFLAYNANIHKTSTRSSNYLSLNAGLNYAGWFYRHHGYFESTSTGQLNRYRSSLNTLYRDIDSLHARLSLGEFYSTNMSESLALLGVQLSSDDNMLPWSMRNYAPIISGVANSNALIRVSQNGQKIYEKSVAAGGFELTDLATLSNGDLRVEIIENNNEVRVLNFPMQVNIDLLKKGRMKYSLATGRFRLSNKITDHVIGQANLSYGLNNYITLSSALTYAEIYKNIMLNAAMNTAIGGLSFSAAESRSSLNKQSQVGQLYQVKYNYYYEAQQLQIHFNASNQSVSYQGANNALSIANYDQLNQEEYWSFWHTRQLKS